MTSKAFSQSAFVIPKSSIDGDSQEQSRWGHRNPSVYDAVAGILPLTSSLALIYHILGRISTNGFIPKQLAVASTRDSVSSSTAALSPEAVLFRTKNAPTRYAESDIYFSEGRNTAQDRPESDLLKAIHCYTSDFYSRSTSDGGVDDWKSLDETALMALGILMEEAALETLGEAGDLVFTEGARKFEPPPIATARWTMSKARPSKKRRID